MPQMAPISWLNLFISFTLILLALNSLNYFSFKYNNSSSQKSPKIKTINWKW